MNYYRNDYYYDYYKPPIIKRGLLENNRLYIADYKWVTNTSNHLWSYWTRIHADHLYFNSDMNLSPYESAIVEWNKYWGTKYKDAIVADPKATPPCTKQQLLDWGMAAIYVPTGEKTEVAFTLEPVDYNTEVFVAVNLTNCYRGSEEAKILCELGYIQGPPAETFEYTVEEFEEEGMVGMWYWDRVVENGAFSPDPIYPEGVTDIPERNPAIFHPEVIMELEESYWREYEFEDDDYDGENNWAEEILFIGIDPQVDFVSPIESEFDDIVDAMAELAKLYPPQFGYGMPLSDGAWPYHVLEFGPRRQKTYKHIVLAA